MQYFVAPSGNDSNPGTQAAPFKTVSHAATIAKTGDTITLRGGIYRETVKPAVDGLTFSGMTGETPTITGTDTLTGFTPSPTNPSIHTLANQPTLGIGSDQLFVNGKMWPEARWPKMGPDISRPIKSKVTSIINVGQTQATWLDSALAPSPSMVGAAMQVMAGEGWVAIAGTVTAHTNQQLTVSYTLPESGTFAQTYEWPKAGDAYFLYNTKSVFTTSGEWFYDPTSKLLSIWTQGALSSIEAKRRKYAFDLSGRKNTTITGIRLFACTVQMDTNSGGNVITGIGAQYTSHFWNYSGWEAPDDSGIVCGGTGNKITANMIQYSAGDGVTAYGANHTIDNNQIFDVDYSACDGAGVRMKYGSAYNVDYNLIVDSGRDGIKFSNVTGSVLSYNRLKSLMLQATDGGGLYAYGTDGKGTEIHHNAISDVHGGGFGGAGVYLDNNSTNYSVHHNVAYDCDHGGKHNHNHFNNHWDKNTLIGISHAIDADQTTGFNGTVYSNNIFQGPAVSLGVEATKINNLGPSPSQFGGATPAGIGAFSDGIFDAGPIVAAPLSRNATQWQQPTTYNGLFGNIKLATMDAQHPTLLAYCDANNWAKFCAVDFGLGSSVLTVQIGGDSTITGKTIEVHLDAPDGLLVGSLKVTGSGTGLPAWFTTTPQSCPLSGAFGVRDVYFVFKQNATCNFGAFTIA